MPTRTPSEAAAGARAHRRAKASTRVGILFDAAPADSFDDSDDSTDPGELELSAARPPGDARAAAAACAGVSPLQRAEGLGAPALDVIGAAHVVAIAIAPRRAFDRIPFDQIPSAPGLRERCALAEARSATLAAQVRRAWGTPLPRHPPPSATRSNRSGTGQSEN
jgi:hypothetical protein